MTDDRGPSGELLSDSLRTTRYGSFLRNSSLDELPELINIMRGQMSLIGPRPLLPEYTGRYSTFQKRRLDVRPGLTGLAQVHGRNALSWEEKFKFDVEYVDSANFLLDAKILVRTVSQAIRGRDVNSISGGTPQPFNPEIQD